MVVVVGVLEECSEVRYRANLFSVAASDGEVFFSLSVSLYFYFLSGTLVLSVKEKTQKT